MLDPIGHRSRVLKSQVVVDIEDNKDVDDDKNKL